MMSLPSLSRPKHTVSNVSVSSILISCQHQNQFCSILPSFACWNCSRLTPWSFKLKTELLPVIQEGTGGRSFKSLSMHIVVDPTAASNYQLIVGDLGHFKATKGQGHARSSIFPWGLRRHPKQRIKQRQAQNHHRAPATDSQGADLPLFDVMVDVAMLIKVEGKAAGG